jgi:hypothetical protein
VRTGGCHWCRTAWKPFESYVNILIPVGLKTSLAKFTASWRWTSAGCCLSHCTLHTSYSGMAALALQQSCMHQAEPPKRRTSTTWIIPSMTLLHRAAVIAPAGDGRLKGPCCCLPGLLWPLGAIIDLAARLAISQGSSLKHLRPL